jgi:hypothetical protein
VGCAVDRLNLPPCIHGLGRPAGPYQHVPSAAGVRGKETRLGLPPRSVTVNSAHDYQLDLSALDDGRPHGPVGIPPGYIPRTCRVVGLAPDPEVDVAHMVGIAWIRATFVGYSSSLSSYPKLPGGAPPALARIMKNPVGGRPACGDVFALRVMTGYPRRGLRVSRA